MVFCGMGETIFVYTVNHKKGGRTFVIITLENLDRFLRASAMLKHVIDIVWTSIRPSVTRWHGIKTAERLVMISSPHDSPFILVLCISRSSRNSDGVTPREGAKYRWGIKICAIFYQ